MLEDKVNELNALLNLRVIVNKGIEIELQAYMGTASDSYIEKPNELERLDLYDINHNLHRLTGGEVSVFKNNLKVAYVTLKEAKQLLASPEYDLSDVESYIALVKNIRGIVD